MTTIEESVVARLQAHVGVSALIGTRVYPDFLPQESTLPAITYQGLGVRRWPTHGGLTTLAGTTMQLSLWTSGTTAAAQRAALSKQVRLALQALHGTYSSLRIDGSFILNERDDVEPAHGWFRRDMDIEFHHEEAVS